MSLPAFDVQPGQKLDFYYDGVVVQCYYCPRQEQFCQNGCPGQAGWSKNTKKKWHCNCERTGLVPTAQVTASWAPQTKTVQGIGEEIHAVRAAETVLEDLGDAVITDSILAHEGNSSKLDNMWLDIEGAVDVCRGRTFGKHKWSLMQKARNVFVMIGGNDFKKAGPKVKGDLAWNFEGNLRTVLLELKSKCETLTFVLFGDWETWRAGFCDKSEEDGNRYDTFCVRCLTVANEISQKTVWIRNDQLQHLDKTSDGWHFAASAKEGLQDILSSLGVRLKAVAPCIPPMNNPVPKKQEVLRFGPMTRHMSFFENPAPETEEVLCFGCMKWRKATGLIQHVKSCVPVRHEQKVFSFAYAQVKDLNNAFSIYEANYGRIPDFVIADMPKKVWFRSGKPYVSRLYGNTTGSTSASDDESSEIVQLSEHIEPLFKKS